MNSIQDKREQRVARAKDLRALVEDNPGEKWDVPCEEKYTALVAEIDAIDADIERTQKALDIDAQEAQLINNQAEQNDLTEQQAQDAAEIEKSMMVSWIKEGRMGLNNEQNQILVQRHREIKNTLSTGTGSEGGYTVPTEVSSRMIEAMKEYSGMRNVAEILATDGGAELSFPSSDGTAEEGEIVPENAAASAADPTFGTVPLTTHKFSSKIITVPIELIQDSIVDIEAFVRRRIESRLGRITNRLATVGTGTSEPTGIVTAATAGKVGASGQTASVTYDDLVDLQHSVDPAYREMGATMFMLHDNTLRDIKKLKDSQGIPLWLPAIALSEPDTILGDRYQINQHMAVMAANAKSMIYGDLRKYVIRDVMSLLLLRFADSKYMEKGQIGFLAWMRSGGNLTDTTAVKYYQNSAS